MDKPIEKVIEALQSSFRMSMLDCIFLNTLQALSTSPCCSSPGPLPPSISSRASSVLPYSHRPFTIIPVEQLSATPYPWSISSYTFEVLLITGDDGADGFERRCRPFFSHDLQQRLEVRKSGGLGENFQKDDVGRTRRCHDSGSSRRRP
ncbi:unnamed protein product [Spirodela intermedia]|uniref:Uncharacterized protein n=1 Tax=Spirodela intermedia TaxID=51605 RepID=A0A7I8ILU2_SPIIN|nr:unnamed protein product [Spirodela intermedia]CAA6658122.1 unnamed protein product [Spirodela intermedia]